MKIINRIKTHANTSIISKIQIRKTSKSENSFLIETLSKDGNFFRDFSEKILASEVKKTITFFEGKMKKCAFATYTPVYDPVEVDYYIFINPELMEKERVGFELYGPIGEKSANTDIVAYYSFSDTGNDFRQPINNSEIYGFFSVNNFESSGGFKAGLNEIGITYTPIEGSVANFMFLSMEEFKRQFKKEEIPTPKKKMKKEDPMPPEIRKILETVKNEKPAEEIIEEEKIETTQKKGRGRPPKTDIALEETPKTVEVKRGRGRPPKNQSEVKNA